MSFKSQQENWNRLAELDPMWAILSEPEKLGGKWNSSEFYLTGEAEADEVRHELLVMGLPFQGRGLDLGCGAGRVTHGFALYLDEVVGFDLSPNMLELARETAGDNEQFVLNETDDLSPFDDDSFDFVYCNRVLQHIDPDRLGDYTTEMVRVTKPGGVIWLQMLSHPTGNDPKRESSPLPSWGENGETPHYTICSVTIDVMMAGFLELGLIIHQARLVDGGKGQSLASYEYILEKP